MAAAPSTPDPDDYHASMLEHLDVPATPDLLAELTRPVPAGEVLEVFDEVLPTLEALQRRGVRMAVVSVDVPPRFGRAGPRPGLSSPRPEPSVAAAGGPLGCREQAAR
jgi:hypothetical protein